MLKRLEASERNNVELTKQLSALQEFVANNIGCSTDAVRTYATAAASGPPSSTATTTPPPPRPNAEALAFKVVRNGSRPTNKAFLPITTHNRFAVLAEEKEEAFETRLIGDSIVRGQLEEFCGRARATRKRLCMPGGRLDDFTTACEEATSNSTNDTLYIIHAGTNDVHQTRSEELMIKYKRMIQAFKEKTNNIVISGILPRIRATNSFYSRAFSTNNRLRSLCSQEGVDFINMWDDFFEQPHLFRGDGLHLNDVGSARFGRLMSNKVSHYRPKNEARPAPDVST